MPGAVRDPDLRTRALAEIRRAIVVGDLTEDRIYSAAALAKQLGMSLSPVREAMMFLVAEGTVTAVPNRGFRLTPITADDLEEIIRIRLLLSAEAVRVLCVSASAAELEELAALAVRAEEAAAAADKAGFFEADRRFHERLLALGLGQRAASISLRLRDQSRLTAVGEKSALVDAESAAQLTSLVALIRDGEAAAAEALVGDNLYYFRKREPEAAAEAPGAAEPAASAAGAHG